MGRLSGVLVAVAVAGICLAPAAGADKKKAKPLTAAEVFKRTAPAIVAIDCLGNNNLKIGTASGFIVTDNGKIVTNLHVIQQCDGVTIRLTNGDIYDTANVVEIDARKDLAIIRIKAVALPVLALAESNGIEVGQVVYSIGNPSGLQNTLQQGLVSAFRQLPGLKVVQVSASINAGNSGGPILDDQARVIAVAAAKMTGAENLGFAIPIDYAKGLLDTKTELPFATFATAQKAIAAANNAKGGIAPPPPPPPNLLINGDPLARISNGAGSAAPQAAGPPPVFTTIQTFAGRDWKFEGDGLGALQVALGRIHGVALDHAGNIYATDIASQAIVKIDTTGRLRILLGPDSPPQNRPVNPQGIAVDSAGVVYFGEDGQRVRKILPTGEVAVVAGGDKRGFTPDGAPAIGSPIGDINGVAVTPDGTVVFAEWDNNRVRRVDAQGRLQTVAGDGQSRFAGDGGPGQLASLQHPLGVATDAEGNVFIADEYNGRVRKVSRDGTISTVAGEGVTKDTLRCPTGVAVGGRGDLFIADPCRRQVFKVHNGESSILGGTGTGIREPSGQGGPATAASFDVWAVAVNDRDDVIVASPDYGYLYRIGHDGTFSIAAGAGNWRAPTDGMSAINAVFQHPNRITFDKNGGLLVTDWDANRIYQIDQRGIVITVAGFARGFYNGENIPAKESGIDRPNGVRVRPNGAIVFSESGGNNRIREIGPDGKIRTLAGNGRRDYSGDGGNARNASFNDALGICLDPAGAVYFADGNNNRVRKVTPDGVIQLVAGNGTRGYSGDGGPAERAALNRPAAVEMGPDGSVYIADSGNHRVRRVLPNGTIVTVAGDGVDRFAGDGGPAVTASLNMPWDLAFGPDHALYVLDRLPPRIRRIDLGSGSITTVAGNGNRMMSGDNGSPQNAGLGRWADGLAFDSAGNLYFTEPGGRIRVIRVSSVPGTAPTAIAQPVMGGVPSLAPVLSSGAAIQISADKMETFLRGKIGVWTADDAKAVLGAVRDQRQDSQATLIRFDTPQTSFSSAMLRFDSSGKLASADLTPMLRVTWNAQLAYMKGKFPGDEFQLSQSGDNVTYTFNRGRTRFTVQPDGSIVSLSIF